MSKNNRILIIGAVISGATIAERYAEKLNRKVLVIERIKHVYIIKSNDLSIKVNIIRYIKQLILILFFLDHKILRLKIFKEFITDGYKGNLGVKYTPDNFLKKI